MPETVVDSERVLVAVKAHIASKPSHGQRDLLAAIARIEVESVRQEEEERVARLAASAEPHGQTPRERQTTNERDRELAVMP